MQSLYNISIFLYSLSIRLAALFNPKAKLWVEGRKDIFSRVRKAFQKDDPASSKRAWFHCASLGEFEQGRPVMEMFRTRFPDHKLVVTFFSPSGYEVRKNYAGADFIFYLPADTRKNASRFIDLVNPEMAFFIKYEYWYNYLDVLTERRIPVYFISARFHEDQHFFKWYGSWFREKLKALTWFFVQDTESERLLQQIGIRSVSVSGDTRFDRVSAVASQNREFPVIAEFCRGSLTLVAGSTWKEDEAILIPLIREESPGLKFIIAPHETDPQRVASLTGSLGVPFLKYSEATESNVGIVNILVIDSVGILAQLYKYATLAYVGGAFGSGLHNILEPAAGGVPVIFGPEHKKFREAGDLIRLGGAFSIGDLPGFLTTVNNLLADEELRQKSSQACRDYVNSNRGATRKILEKIHG
jgi:3-deoxy-D-manno-octulosonic-acid transferase